MLMTTHIMVGAAIAVTIAPHSLLLAFVLGVLSHILIDTIPHGDLELYNKYLRGEGVKGAFAYTGIDSLIAIGVIVLLMFQPAAEPIRGAVAMGMLGGLMPDLMVGMEKYLGMSFLNPFYRVHFFFHDYISKKRDVSLLVGIGGQVVAMILMFPLFR
jgi:hypothetical protein